MNRINSINLHEASRKLGIPQEQIVSIFDQSGFPVLNMPMARLDSYHLEVLSDAYVNSVKSLYKRVSKNYKDSNVETQNEWRRFFARFIKKRFSIWMPDIHNESYDRVFEASLNEDLIKDFFWELLTESDVSEYGQIHYISKADNNYDLFRKYKYKIKIKVKPKFSFTDFKTNIFSFILCSHYYIFSDDEENSRDSKSKLCFSGISNISREALKFINYLKFHLKWKIYNHLLKT